VNEFAQSPGTFLGASVALMHMVFCLRRRAVRTPHSKPVQWRCQNSYGVNDAVVNRR
jgi:hypothetical protein